MECDWVNVACNVKEKKTMEGLQWLLTTDDLIQDTFQ